MHDSDCQLSLFMGFLFYRSSSTRFSSNSNPDTIDGAMILSNEEQQTHEKSLSENLKNRHCALVLCSRNFVLTSIIATLSDTPVIKCALAITVNFIFFIAVSIWKFSAFRIKRIIIMICEGLNTLIPILFLLCATVSTKISNQENVTLGWFIIAVVSLALALSLLYALVEAWNIAWQLFPILWRLTKKIYLLLKDIRDSCYSQRKSITPLKYPEMPGVSLGLEEQNHKHGSNCSY